MRRTWKREETAIILVPSGDPEVGPFALAYLDRLLSTRNLKNAVIASDDLSFIGNRKHGSELIVKTLQLTGADVEDLLRLSVLYRFDSNFIIASLDQPLGRNGSRLVGVKGISKEEIFCVGIYGLSPSTESNGSSVAFEETRSGAGGPMRAVKRMIQKAPFFAFCTAIIGRVIPGYFQYAILVKRFGRNTAILRTAWHGTGDYYICGMYLQDYLWSNRIDDYIFLVNDRGSEAKVMELFDVYKNHTVKLRSIAQLSRFCEFMRNETPLCRTFECSDQLSFIGERLKGYRGLNLMDFYLRYGFGFEWEPRLQMPKFSQNIDNIMAQMSEKGLLPEKTVLLAPYSTCSKTHLPPDSFWEATAAHLQESGYTVATNCFGREKPVKGTIAISIEYSDIVPFLNEAGSFIGIRSGLCDIISQSSCHKIIIHTEKSEYWPDKCSEVFLGLRAMKLSRTVDELTYSGDTKTLNDEIVRLTDEW
ncbi:hypothetical protein [uncultured Mailhella sp.]|uniref:hypothetical protein n=1 Tax=uncultured Mailhella sp. TaxID=1981031 RepID=UPI0026091172|nr:hypothetical protein [uncultured Mailhella sp.]